MKNARFYLTSIFILFGLLCFGCADGNNNESGTPAQKSPTGSSSTGTQTTGVTTSGTVSSSTVAISKDNDIAMIKVDDKSYYLFTDTTDGANASVSANTLSRAAATIKNGTWMYYEDDKILYSGTYKGDISELTKITDTTSEEALEDFELELTVTAVADEEGDLYPVSTETTEATFTIEIKPDSENAEDFVLEATIPDVIKEETKLLEEVDYTCVAPSYSYPNGIENVETEICKFQFKTDGSVVYTMSGETVTTGSYSENAAEDGKVLITVTSTVAGDEWIGYKWYVTISDGRLLIEGTASPGIFTKSATTAAYSFRKIEKQDEVDLTTTDTVSFYPDKTFYMFEQIESDVGQRHDFVFGGIVCIGKYTGDPTKDGQITLTPEKIADSNGQLKTCTEEQSSPINITISNGEMPLSKGSGEPDDYIRIYPTE